MPQDLITSYKSTVKLGFKEKDLEDKFLESSSNRGKSSSIYAFLALGFMGFSFAYLEYFALAIDSMLSLQLFIVVGLVSFTNAAISFLKTPAPYIKARLISNIVLMMLVILTTVFLIKYRPYYAMEAMLLIILFSLFSNLSLRVSLLSNIVFVGVFIGVMQIIGEASLKVILITNLLFSAVLLGLFAAYLWERMRRTLFLTTYMMDDISMRQEVWSYTLIDLDMALSGVRDFKKLLAHVLEYLGAVISFESSVITSLEGQGPKPKPLQIEGELFENEEVTIWGDDLVSKLEQTRQAFNSDCYTEKKGFLGKKIKEFKHFRLDIPVFNEFNLVGIISLRREDRAFDDLDMTASVSLMSQAMLIFNRSKHTQDKPSQHLSQRLSKKPLQSKIDETNQKVYSEETSDISLTNSTEYKDEQKKFLQSSPNVNVAPKAIQDAFKKKGDAAKKSLLILSRENADKISVDRYRTAAIDGAPLSFIIMEIDGLSGIREADGDKVAYRVFSGIAKQLFLKIDKEKHIVGRYGKNGISILMPGVDMNAAEKFSETFRLFVADEKYKTVYGTRTATLSVGIAAITDDTGDYASMLKRADMALFVAKKNGRNCVKVRL